MEITQDSTDVVNESKAFDIDAALKQELHDLAAENKRLESFVVKLQSQKNKLSTKLAAHNDEMECMGAKLENTTNQLEDLRFELEKSISREEKLEYQIVEVYIIT